MASIVNIKCTNNAVSNNSTEMAFSDSLKNAEAVLFKELSSCYKNLNQQEFNIESFRNLANIQCALEILQSAKTSEEQAMLNDILKAMQTNN